jgi:3-isopropylmalate/(R)-2-methylmalate dehydratase large subunit
MLDLLALPFFRNGEAIGRVLEFEGEGVESMSLDERATLTNMAVEAGAFTGIVAADGRTLSALGNRREGFSARVVRADEGATYRVTLRVDLSTVEPMVATPGDPRNGVSVRSLGEEIAIDVAYGGSCTGGKREDMDMYAHVLSHALAEGRTVAPGVKLYIQFGSQRIRAYAEERGHVDVFRAVGATLLPPSCGACIQAGPGVSERADQVTISAINRNFPGRSGPGKVFLASPLVVAESAIAGVIRAPTS